MSISDRLDEIEARRSQANSSLNGRHMMVGKDVPEMLAALRAVLDVCNETTIEAHPHGGGEPYMIVPVREVRAAVEAALGEES